ncbi:MAG: hydroxypyruvate isomerase family protein [Schleiferiaceae bacterium]
MSLAAATALPSHIYASGTLAGSGSSRPFGYKRSVSHWTVSELEWEDLCPWLADQGIEAIDLVGPENWHHLKKHGLDSSMCNGAELNLVDGFIHEEFESVLHQRYAEMIPRVAKAGYQNLICFSGNRRGLGQEDGLQQAVRALRPMVQLAEEHGVVLQMELFNSIVDHPDYMADSSSWGIALAKELASPSFKLLYDIYHMQIMEGNLIQNIQENHNFYGHYHVAGVPGRNEPWNNQEINYPAVMEAIDKVGFDGYVALEYVFAEPIKESMQKSYNEFIQ